MMSRRLLVISVFALAGALAQSSLRSVTGVVTEQDGSLAKGAVVKLKDMATLQIRSFVTADDGSYRFSNLLDNRDYELYAQLGEKRSSRKTLSRFDSKQDAVVDLRISD